jgi:hypothetical protein
VALVNTLRMRIRAFATTFVLALLTCGCAASIPLASKSEDSAVRATTGPPEGKASIFVERGNNFAGSAILFHLVVDGQRIGGIAPGTYRVVTVAPGLHRVTMFSNENEATRDINAEAGREYFFGVGSRPGWGSARVALEDRTNMGRRALGKNRLAK